MKNNTVILLFLLGLSLTACKKVNDKNPMVIGNWQGTEWLVLGKPTGQDATQVYFQFDENGGYKAGFGDQTQQGTWRTEGNKLYTTETGKKEIVVKLLTADGAKLKFEMNRGGQIETLELVKVMPTEPQ